MDPDPDPSLFIIDLQDVNKDKKTKNCRNQGFSYYFLLNDRRIRVRILVAQNM
jgi:hypothetical protein